MGWKQGFREPTVNATSRLSENQCGMETKPLGRKPSDSLWLSENQCGMETRSVRATTSRVPLSENQCGMETCSRVVHKCLEWLSENQCGMETCFCVCKHQRIEVEREPMWDGNTISKFAKFCPAIELSENQCGMETAHVALQTLKSKYVEREP